MISSLKKWILGERAFTPYANHQITRRAFCVDVSMQFTEYRRYRGAARAPETYFGNILVQGHFYCSDEVRKPEDSVDSFEILLKTRKDVYALHSKLESWKDVLELEGLDGAINSLVRETMHSVAEKGYA
jgi:hypothetical protein